MGDLKEPKFVIIITDENAKEIIHDFVGSNFFHFTALGKCRALAHGKELERPSGKCSLLCSCCTLCCCGSDFVIPGAFKFSMDGNTFIISISGCASAWVDEEITLAALRAVDVTPASYGKDSPNAPRQDVMS